MFKELEREINWSSITNHSLNYIDFYVDNCLRQCNNQIIQ